MENDMLQEVFGETHGPHVVVGVARRNAVLSEIIEYTQDAGMAVVQAEIVLPGFLVHAREVENKGPVLAVHFGHIAGGVAGKPLLGTIGLSFSL